MTVRLLRLLGPALPRAICPLCAGAGFVALTTTRLARQCPTCRGLGSAVDDRRFADGFDVRAYQLGLAPRGPAH